MKEHLEHRRQQDMKRLQKYEGRNVSKELQKWVASVKDPTVRIVPTSPSHPINNGMILTIQAGLRYMQSWGTPAAFAHTHARAFGYTGELAWRVEDYEAVLAEKFGDGVRNLEERNFLHHMASGPRKILPSGLDCQGMQRCAANFERQILLLRASLRACEMFDVSVEEVTQVMSMFGKAGVAAFSIEDYGARMLTRREMTRGGLNARS